MKFTLVFPSLEAVDLSVGMTFQPCIVWTLGSKILLNPHREDPYYRVGDFQVLLDLLGSKNLLSHPRDRMAGLKIFIIVHAIGHGREKDLQLLEEDIASEGLIPVAVR